MLKRFINWVVSHKKIEDINQKSYLMKQVKRRLNAIETTLESKNSSIDLWLHTCSSPHEIYLNYFNRFTEETVFNEFKKMFHTGREDARCIRSKNTHVVNYLQPYGIECPHCERLKTRERFIKLMSTTPLQSFLKFSSLGKDPKETIIREFARLEDTVLVNETPVDIDAFMDMIDDVIVIEHTA